MRFLFSIPPDGNPNRLTIYVVASQEGVAKIYGDKRAPVAGFYHASKFGSYAVVNRETTDDKFELAGETVLFHEYAHHFMFRHFAYAYPLWYSEGFAEYVANTSFDSSGRWTLGNPPLYRAYSILEAKPIPIETLLFGTLHGLDAEQMDTFYGEAWLLTYLLQNDLARKGQLAAYLRAIASGTPERKAAVAIFGDLNVLEREMNSVKEKRLTSFKSKEPLAFDHSLKISKIDDVSSQLITLELQRRSSEAMSKVPDDLLGLTQKHPDRADVWLELALTQQAIAEESKKPDESTEARRAAGTAVDKALAIDPQMGRANSLRAELMIDGLKSLGNANAEEWKAVRHYIALANAADNDDPIPLFLYYDSFIAQGIEPNALAREGLFKAFSMEPEAKDLRIECAFDLANCGLYDDAVKLVELVARDPHDPAQGEAVLKQLQDMRDRAAGKGTTPHERGSKS